MNDNKIDNSIEHIHEVTTSHEHVLNKLKTIFSKIKNNEYHDSQTILENVRSLKNYKYYSRFQSELMNELFNFTKNSADVDVSYSPQDEEYMILEFSSKESDVSFISKIKNAILKFICLVAINKISLSMMAGDLFNILDFALGESSCYNLLKDLKSFNLTKFSPDITHKQMFGVITNLVIIIGPDKGRFPSTIDSNVDSNVEKSDEVLPGWSLNSMAVEVCKRLSDITDNDTLKISVQQSLRDTLIDLITVLSYANRYKGHGYTKHYRSEIEKTICDVWGGLDNPYSNFLFVKKIDKIVEWVQYLINIMVFKTNIVNRRQLLGSNYTHEELEYLNFNYYKSSNTNLKPTHSSNTNLKTTHSSTISNISSPYYSKTTPNNYKATKTTNTNTNTNTNTILFDLLNNLIDGLYKVTVSSGVTAIILEFEYLVKAMELETSTENTISEMLNYIIDTLEQYGWRSTLKYIENLGFSSEPDIDILIEKLCPIIKREYTIRPINEQAEIRKYYENLVRDKRDGDDKIDDTFLYIEEDEILDYSFDEYEMNSYEILEYDFEEEEEKEEKEEEEKEEKEEEEKEEKEEKEKEEEEKENSLFILDMIKNMIIDLESNPNNSTNIIQIFLDWGIYANKNKMYNNVTDCMLSYGFLESNETCEYLVIRNNNNSVEKLIQALKKV